MNASADEIEVVAVLAYPPGTVLARDLTPAELISLSSDSFYAESSVDAPVGMYERRGRVERVVTIKVATDGPEHQMAKSSARFHEDALAHQLAVLARAVDTGRLSGEKLAVLDGRLPNWRSPAARAGYRSSSDTDSSLDAEYDEIESDDAESGL